jgi:cell wall-associated NlpC family hydrolase
MAHFHKLNGGERISCQQITVPMTSSTAQYKIGLWGYRDFAGRELQVVTDNRGVTAVPKNIIGNSREWVVTSTIRGTVRLEATTVDGHVWDWVELTFVGPNAHIDNLRRAIVAEAERHIGAHYLWGACGATPGNKDGMPGRPGAVELVPDNLNLDKQNPCLKAASCSVAGLFICGGRYEKVGNRVLNQKDEQLRKYLDGLKKKHQSQWEPMERFNNIGLWPRNIRGGGAGTIVLGESCIGKRHFDCVGFVNYCLSIVLRSSIQLAIEAWTEQVPEVKDENDDRPGDILTIGTKHIGFATGDGWVIHAKETASGVVREPLKRGSWRRGRLGDFWFRQYGF